MRGGRFAPALYDSPAMHFDLTDDQRAIAEAVKKICARFPDEYWSHKDTAAEFPHEFHAAMAADGWLGITIPEPNGVGIADTLLLDERGRIGRALQSLLVGRRN